jgi:hypothetical protein
MSQEGWRRKRCWWMWCVLSGNTLRGSPTAAGVELGVDPLGGAAQRIVDNALL